MPRLDAGLLILAALAGGCGGSGDSLSSVPVDTTTRGQLAIEEPDLYKLVGSVLYLQNPATGLNVIDVANARSPRLLGRAPVTGGAGAEIFALQGNLVVIVLKSATPSCTALSSLPSRGWDAGTEVALVDATSRTSPAVLGRYCIPGTLIDTRTVDQVLYLATQNPDPNSTGSRAIALQLANPRSPAVSGDLDLPGAGGDILVTETAIVVATALTTAANETTRVLYLSTALDGSLTSRGHLDVPGFPQGRFHLDLSGNQFRILTFNSVSRDSTLSIIDTTNPDLLRQVGALNHIGPGEKLYATRFVGDRAYVVTYRRLDPLYTISLTDPTSPAIIGSLTLPGWSDYLFPVGTDKLVAVGRGDNGLFVGVSLFDVSDPTRTEAVDQRELGTISSGSEANVDYRGLTLVESATPPYFVVPYSSVTWGTDRSQREYCSARSNSQVIEIGPRSLVPRGSAEQLGSVRRTVPDGTQLLAISDYELRSLDITNRDALHADAVLTVGTDQALQDSVKASCEYDRSFHFGYGECVVGPGSRPRGAGLLLLVALSLFIARRRRN